MKRRQLIKTSVAGGLVIGLGGAGVLLSGEKNTENLTIDAALAQLDLLTADNLSNSGVWSPYQIFIHCAQSVEYSMSGFPEHKSKLFKSTLGRLAISLFSSQGKMTHGLSEPIPGAPPFAAQQDTHVALNRLKQSLIAFKQYTGDLEPHFVYGELSKRDYEVAHVMHLHNHLQEIES